MQNKNFIFIVAIIFLLQANISLGQPGIKAGLTVSNFLFANTQMDPDRGFEVDLRPFLGYDVEWAQLGEQKPLFTPYFSIYYNFQIAPRFNIRPELSYLAKGVSFNQWDYQKVTYKVCIHYLEIPLSLGYKIIEKEKIIGELFAGGYGGVKLNAFKKTALHNDKKEKSALSTVQYFDAGVHLGFHCKYKLFEHMTLLELRFFHGLTNIFELSEDGMKLYYQKQDTKLLGFNISVGYEF
jgi:hypothetical protein